MTGFQPSRRDRATQRVVTALLRLPPGVKRRLAGPPHVVDADPLDVDMQLGLGLLGKAQGSDIAVREVAAARAQMERDCWIFGGPLAPVAQVKDLLIPGRDGAIAARLTLPLEPARTPLPLVVYYHGGGWVIGSPDSHESVARAITHGAGVAVLNVDYRLAPEHPFPAAVHDGLDAFLWAHARAGDWGVDADRIAVAGDSAGANIAAVVSNVLAREPGPQPAHQFLFVPATDFSRRRESRDLFGDGYFLTDTNMTWYEDHYLGPDTDRSNPLASPLLEAHHAGTPPAYIVVAGFDPLRDDGQAYAAALTRAGVPVTLRSYGSGVHPMMNLLISPLGRRAMAEATNAIRAALTR